SEKQAEDKKALDEKNAQALANAAAMERDEARVRAEFTRKQQEEKDAAQKDVTEQAAQHEAKLAEDRLKEAKKQADEKEKQDKVARDAMDQANAERLKAEQLNLEAKAAEENRVAEAKAAAEKLAAEQAAALAEAERLKIVALEERVKNLVLVDAVTPNQKSTGHAVMQLGLGNRLLQTVLFSQKGEVLAYDSLSGEAHASLRGALLQDAGLVSGAASERVRAAFDGIGAKSAPVATPLAYGPEAKDKRSVGEAFAAATPAPAVSTTALWGQAYGGWSHGASDGNAAAYSRSTGGIVTGMDALIAGTWRLGLLAGYGSTSLHGAGSSVSADSYQLGIYGGTRIDALTLSLGTVLAHHVIDSRRTVSFGSLEETDTAGYSANTVQLFGEAAYRIETPYAALEPFAAAAHTHLKTSGFTETGGIAALSAPSSSTDLTTTTLGLRASRAFTLGNATTLTARGMAGWRHAYGDVTPQAQFAFASGGESFDVSGLPVAADAALVEAGLAFDIGRATTLGLTYTGQFSSGVNDNAVKADLTVRF
ncbi:autotransporter domain-containing protein, partial [Phyllobacterium sp. NPDC097923]|uniref:autotransporter outer membrane beta-barrel domain-containing protein n=1 Tax=Phyllobacterium sp. NPDC097923 TaxID=3364404 RepID=UPI00383BBE0E